MVQAYMDDSGSHANSHNCVVAGYFGGVAELGRFERQWQPIIERYGVSEFHAKRFWARDNNAKPVGEYKGWSERKLFGFLDALLKVIESRKIYPFASGVLGEEWKKHSLAQRRVFTGATRQHPSGAPSKPIFMGFVTNVIRIAFYCKPGIRVNFVFDDNPKTEEWAYPCYDGIKQMGGSLSSRLGELTFASSAKAVPLQAADLLAYQAHKWAKEANGNANHSVNSVYRRALTNIRSMDDFWMYDAQRFSYIERMAELNMFPK